MVVSSITIALHSMYSTNCIVKDKWALCNLLSTKEFAPDFGKNSSDFAPIKIFFSVIMLKFGVLNFTRRRTKNIVLNIIYSHTFYSFYIMSH